MHQQVQVLEVVRQQQFLVPQEVEDVPEHTAVAVDKVMLLQRVQHYGYRAVEHLAETRIWVTRQ